MKTIEVDEELYRYIASHTQHIGESASDILRRMLKFTAGIPARNMSTVVEAAQANMPVVAVPAKLSHERVVHELLLSNEYTEQNKAINRFMMILSTLYSIDPKGFSIATDALHGRTRTYFAGDQQTLLANGTHTKPKQVSGTPYWVITNTNTGRKRSMIEHIMQAMQFPAELIEKVCGTV
ncbi:replication initiation negative regulator SeqA [Serratia sp. UGAL515B_01]|uniref:replication initiation negative regulator SeqA n=1 Tax=Serratia sp. UGAL515B_01 TaxID=2986763 RepID=UPI0029552595|nr:replication initiation negative regulator SeqA [Serratia sp. UGAL515B_01]WON76081.1 replication initiation negative regulator SeqA [Serratia sp. UGAL515B_01]